MKLPKVDLSVLKSKAKDLKSKVQPAKSAGESSAVKVVAAPKKKFDFALFMEDLKSLQYRDPGAWPLWAYKSAAVIVGLVLFGLVAYFFTMPQYDQIDIEVQKEVALKKDFEAKQEKVAALDAYKAQLAEMEHSFADMLKQLPSKTEVSSLLNDISQARAAAGLEEELFQPQGENLKDFYAIIPNHITVTGDYLKMGAFAGAVAALPRIVTMSDVTLVPIDPKTGGSMSVSSSLSTNVVPSGTLRMDAQIFTYRYLDAEEVRAQDEAKAAAKKKASAANKADASDK